jgi:hypothetical protein
MVNEPINSELLTTTYELSLNGEVAERLKAAAC